MMYGLLPPLNFPPGTPPQIAGGVQALHSSVSNILLVSRMKQNTLSLGVNWILANDISLKIQVDRSHIDANGSALWGDLLFSGTGQYVTLLSVNMNLVF